MPGNNLRQLIEEILLSSREMVLATAIRSTPWIATLVFGHDQELNLYWVSDINSRHSQELEKNSIVAVAVTTQPTGDGQDKGLQIQGNAYKLQEDKILQAAIEYFKKRGTDHLPENLQEVNKLTQGRSWYVVVPQKIYIIYGPLFGYERKVFELKS